MCFHQSFTGVHSVKRSETLHGTIIAKERRNGEGLGRFGSGQVGSGESHSLPDSIQTPIYFRSALRFAPFTVHFFYKLNSSKRLCYHSISCEKAVMQTANDYYRYFLGVCSGAIYFEIGIERQNECIFSSWRREKIKVKITELNEKHSLGIN